MLSMSCVITESLDAETRAAVIRLCIAAHDNADFENLFEYIPSGGRHFLGYEEGHLVAHALVTTRWLQPDGLPELKTAYVDAVSTSPSHQGKGHGSAVMRELARDVASDYAIACLETERQGFYSQLGWESWRGPLAGRSASGLVPTPQQQGVMILRLPQTPRLDLDRLLTIECQPARIW